MYVSKVSLCGTHSGEWYCMLASVVTKTGLWVFFLINVVVDLGVATGHWLVIFAMSQSLP